MQFFDEKDDNRDNEEAKKLLKKMQCSLVVKEIGFTAALRFFSENITGSENSAFIDTNIVKILDSLFSKLDDFSETNNLAASAALRKHTQVSEKTLHCEIWVL